jgi:hypothetical protein
MRTKNRRHSTYSQSVPVNPLVISDKTIAFSELNEAFKNNRIAKETGINEVRAAEILIQAIKNYEQY